MKKSILSIITLVALALSLTLTAQASLLSLDVSGTFGASTTLDSTSLDGNAFTYHAVFDTTSAANPLGAIWTYNLISFNVLVNSNSYDMASGTVRYAYFAMNSNNNIAGLALPGFSDFFSARYLLPANGAWNPAAVTPMNFSSL